LDQIINVVFEVDGQLEKFMQFLLPDGELDTLLAGYFAKVHSFLRNSMPLFITYPTTDTGE
jgi:hypothetical protein